MNVSIDITDGIGTINLADGNYDVSTNVLGYNNSSISPKSILVTEKDDTKELVISASGTLTLHLVETDTDIPILGAKFYRCSSYGVIYGNAITTDDFGNATFNNVPFSEFNSVYIYFRQIESDGKHNFDDNIKRILVDKKTKIVDVYNTLVS